MSPVPEPSDIPDHSDEDTVHNEPLPNHLIGQINTDSEDEDEDNDVVGGLNYTYAPLSQDPEEAGPADDDSSDSDNDGDSVPTPVQMTETLDQDSVPDLPAPNKDEMLWNQPRSCPSGTIDADQAEKVKSAMAGFQLPSSHHPDWARNISEQDWKTQLLSRIDTPKTVDFKADFSKMS